MCGYPAGLAGERIPTIARAFALVDVFDALVSERPYKHGWPLPDAMTLLEAGVGTHFDPRLAQPFFGLLPTIFPRFGGLSEGELKPHVVAMRLRHFGA